MSTLAIKSFVTLRHVEETGVLENVMIEIEKLDENVREEIAEDELEAELEKVEVQSVPFTGIDEDQNNRLLQHMIANPDFQWYLQAITTSDEEWDPSKEWKILKRGKGRGKTNR